MSRVAKDMTPFGDFTMLKAGLRLLTMLLAIAAASAASAATCATNGAGFAAWLKDFERQALASGISPATVSSALDGLSYAPDVIAKDRAQNVFAQNFLQFSDRMVAKYRLQKGAQLIKANAKLFTRIDKDYGVTAPVLVAFWGLETDFGANLGDMPTLRSLATLAYDCRRSDLFRDQLMAALTVIDRGDLTAAQMKGPWAGELGQVQFLATHYRDFAVDYDGDGKRDLLHSTPDVLASAAALLVHEGWQRGQPWLTEVRVPATLDWSQSDLSVRKSVAEWQSLGITAAPGSTLGAASLPATLILPMGRNGPAFLGYANFDVYLQWNQSFVYALTAAYYATRLAGAPPVSRGGNVDGLSFKEVQELQKLLAVRGHPVGKADGMIGSGTRASVRAAQLELGLPADGYPDTTLLQKLRAGG
ncbi:lytic murein transglycosylase [Mesorhizobium sp. BR1-1-16]|uniref:lytic murein transglycosylase n=1 Tax=Mesorhizobium sp. BR1-1-16 TaxID=2876653 RepID=UPI001CCCB6D2|nr:lytic murein transglycosylase [Mesorhizobium sp. BR1-1-16]MBZ9936516.1 lytic murein transglycosylase [Mesorhizobium sp. BR1-1-16]